jgi:hypothetical protein
MCFKKLLSPFTAVKNSFVRAWRGEESLKSVLLKWGGFAVFLVLFSIFTIGLVIDTFAERLLDFKYFIIWIIFCFVYLMSFNTLLLRILLVKSKNLTAKILSDILFLSLSGGLIFLTIFYYIVVVLSVGFSSSY